MDVAIKGDVNGSTLISSLPPASLPKALTYMRYQLLNLLWLIALLLCAGAANATEIEELAKRIDHHIEQRLAKEAAQPAGLVDDGGFLRRVTLDLAGRIPTTAERDAFLQSTDENRKQKLVQQLIDSPDFAYHQRNQLDLLLLLREEHNDKWREYLLEATRENRSWERLFREIMQPEDTLSDDPRPVAFLNRRANDLDAMTNDSSVIWFGVNIACAKCHDHPLVDDWKQSHYFGMAAFFKRTFRTRKGFLSERFEGNPKYTDLSGEEHEAEFMFLTGAKVESPQWQIGDEEKKTLQEKIKKSEQDDKAEAPPRPEFRPRAKLVELALAGENERFFSRNIVNRIWARFFGRGIVHPLDQLHSENEASHEELLNELAADMRDSQYDMRRMIHAIVLSNAYARSIRYESSAELPKPELFAVAIPRPLSPRQLSLSLKIAASSPARYVGISADDWAAKRDELEKQAEGFARRTDIPGDDFQVSVTEALWFSNNNSAQNDLLNGSGERIVGFLKETQSDREVAIAATRSIFSREADEEEILAVIDYLSKRTDRREDGIKQVAWALMCSPEFRFNH